MKKIIMTAAVIACAASIASAQPVQSANIVGYNKVETAVGFKIVAQQFEGSDATPTGLFSDTMPIGSKVYQFVPGVGYNVSEYKTIFLSGDAWDTPLDLSEGSFWIEASSVNNSIFSGEVNMAETVTNSIPPSFSMLTYPYPVEVGVDDLGITPVIGDKIYQFVPGVGYNVSEYKTIFLSGDAWDTPLVFAVGDGFWYESASSSTNVWVATRPF